MEEQNTELTCRVSRAAAPSNSGDSRASQALVNEMRNLRRRRRESVSKKESAVSRDSLGRFNASPGTRSLQLKSLNLTPTTIRATVISDIKEAGEIMLPSRNATSSNKTASLAERTKAIITKDSPFVAKRHQYQQQQAAESSTRAGSVEFDKSLVPPEEPLGIALLNSVQMWYIVSLIFASFFIVSVIVNVILCCAFRRKVVKAAAMASSVSSISCTPPPLHHQQSSAAIYAAGSNDFLVVQEMEELEAKQMDRKYLAKASSKALAPREDKWNKFFGGKSRKEMVIEYDNRSQLSGFFNWTRAPRPM